MTQVTEHCAISIFTDNHLYTEPDAFICCSISQLTVDLRNASKTSALHFAVFLKAAVIVGKGCCIMFLHAIHTPILWLDK